MANRQNVGKIMPFWFSQVSLYFLVPYKPLNQQHRLKNTNVTDLSVCMVIQKKLLNLKNQKRLFEILRAIFNHIHLFSKVPVCTKIKNRYCWTWFVGIILDPCTQASMKIHSFAQFWTVLQDPTMRPCWQPNQGECSDRLIH